MEDVDTSDATALVLAALANALGAAVAIGMWRRHRRRRRALRSRHPSVRPPLTVALVGDPPRRRIRLAVPRGAPEMAIDIVSFRHRGGSWDSEPLDEPVMVAPGAETVLASEIDADSLDVVVAWTARHETGDVQGSRLFRIPPERDDPVPPPRTAAGLTGRATLLLLGLLALSGVVVAMSATDDRTRGEGLQAQPVPTQPTPRPLQPTAPTTIQPTTIQSTTTDGVDLRATVSLATLPPATSTTAATSTAAATSTPSATPPAATTTAAPTTVAPTTTAATSDPATSAAGGTAVVRVEGREAPCQFGDDCLVADFTIAGFDPPPREYVCEFEDGSRFTFQFNSSGVEGACATVSGTATITVEVAGVRSDTVTRP